MRGLGFRGLGGSGFGVFESRLRVRAQGLGLGSLAFASRIQGLGCPQAPKKHPGLKP